MNVTVSPGRIGGSLAAPASKSMAHRTLIGAALADRPTQVVCSASSQDIDATVDCLTALGARISRTETGFAVTPVSERGGEAELDCRESGSTLRFLLPVAAALSKRARFTGRGRLPQRPMQPLMEALTAHGVRFSAEQLPFSIDGALTGGAFAMEGGVSSQFFSGLLFALPLLHEPSTLTFRTPAQSLPYFQMTLQTLAAFGVDIPFDGTTAVISSHEQYRSPGTCAVEGDWSNAAFFLCSAAIRGEITVKNLRLDSGQGDRRVLELIRSFGAAVTAQSDGVTVRSGERRPIQADCADIPDVVPILAVMSCFAEGVSRFERVERLRMKESDRLTATVELINALGGRAECDGSSLTVYGGGTLRGGLADGRGDHRMVMCAAVAGCHADGAVTVTDAEAVSKSYPLFFTDYRKVGGEVKEDIT